MKKELILNETAWESLALRLQLASSLLSSVCCSPVFGNMYPVRYTDKICDLSKKIEGQMALLEDVMFEEMTKCKYLAPPTTFDASHQYKALIHAVLMLVDEATVPSGYDDIPSCV